MILRLNRLTRRNRISLTNQAITLLTSSSLNLTLLTQIQIMMLITVSRRSRINILLSHTKLTRINRRQTLILPLFRQTIRLQRHSRQRTRLTHRHLRTTQSLKSLNHTILLITQCLRRLRMISSSRPRILLTLRATHTQTRLRQQRHKHIISMSTTILRRHSHTQSTQPLLINRIPNTRILLISPTRQKSRTRNRLQNQRFRQRRNRHLTNLRHNMLTSIRHRNHLTRQQPHHRSSRITKLRTHNRIIRIRRTNQRTNSNTLIIMTILRLPRNFLSHVIRQRRTLTPTHPNLHSLRSLTLNNLSRLLRNATVKLRNITNSLTTNVSRLPRSQFLTSSLNMNSSINHTQHHINRFSRMTQTTSRLTRTLNLRPLTRHSHINQRTTLIRLTSNTRSRLIITTMRITLTSLINSTVPHLKNRRRPTRRNLLNFSQIQESTRHLRTLTTQLILRSSNRQSKTLKIGTTRQATPNPPTCQPKVPYRKAAL